MPDLWQGQAHQREAFGGGMMNLNHIDAEIDRLGSNVSTDQSVGRGNFFIVIALLLIARAIIAIGRQQ